MQKLRCPAIHKGDALRQNRRLPVYETEKQRINFIRFVKMKLILFVSNALRAYCIAHKNAGCMFFTSPQPDERHRCAFPLLCTKPHRQP